MTTDNPLANLVDDLVAKGHHGCAGDLREAMAALTASRNEDAEIGRIVKQQAALRLAMLQSNKQAAPEQVHNDPTLTVLQQIIDHGRSALADGSSVGKAAPRISGLLPESAPRIGAQTENTGAETPAVQVLSDGGPPCNPHPDAPHGFNRNGSHNSDRYMCDCEGWQPDSATVGARPINDVEREMLREGLVNGALSIQGDAGDVAQVAWRSQMPGDSSWLLTTHEPTPPGIIKQPLITLADHARIVASLEDNIMDLQKKGMRLMIENIGVGAAQGANSTNDSVRLNWLIDQACDFYPSSEGSNTTEPDLYAVALNLGAGEERRARVRAYIDEKVIPETTPAAKAHIANTDRLAIQMLVAAGFVTEEKANQALLIATGFSKGPMPQASSARDTIKERNDVGAALESAAERLPVGWEIRVCAERHAGTVDLIDDEGNTVEHDFNYDEGLAGAILGAIDVATASNTVDETIPTALPAQQQKKKATP